MDDRQKLNAVRSLIDGVWDDPDLCLIGPLSGDKDYNIRRILDDAKRSPTPFDHLEPVQITKIRETAEDRMWEDCRRDPKYMRWVIESYLKDKSLQFLLETVAQDEEERRRSLGFNPETGEDNEE